MSSSDDFNTQIIEEFRANAGRVSGPFEGATLLLLHHRGARTGTARVNPVVYQRVGDAMAIFAAKGGAPNNPHWYLNLKANPQTQVEVGTETIDVVARELAGDERQEVWERQKELTPGVADYEEKTKGLRQIPVILLEPKKRTQL